MNEPRQFLATWANMKRIKRISDPARLNEFRHAMADRFPQAAEAFARQRRGWSTPS